jgi:hypothetical protein
MKGKRLSSVAIWALAYLLLLGVGTRTGLPMVIVPTLLVLTLPPLFFCIRASRRVMRRTSVAFPDQWTALNLDPMKLELRCFLFDERTFGDEAIAAWKHELRWWTRAGIVAIVLFLPTMLFVEKLSK